MADNAKPTGAGLSIRAEGAEVRRASEWLQRSGAKRGVPPGEIGRLELCLNEVLANVIGYGGPGAHAAPVELTLEVAHGQGRHEATVTVTDAGIAFDTPAAMPRPAPESLTDAQVGGLGIVMIHSFSDVLRYRREDGRNHLTFAVRWEDEAG